MIDHYLCVKLPEEVDHHKSEAICRNADRLITSQQVNNVVFDFEDTKFMDSSGVGIIIGRYKNADIPKSEGRTAFMQIVRSDVFCRCPD